MYQLLSGKQGFAPGAWNSEVVPWQRDDPEGQECAERRGWCASEHPPAASTGMGPQIQVGLSWRLLGIP